MKFARTTFALLALCTLGAHEANAQSALTREQVKAELAEAIRTGDMVAAGDTGLKLNELSPYLYPKRPTQPGKTREQVRAELAEAIRTGDIVSAGDSALKRNEEFPDRYPPVTVAAGKTREQVNAETAEAIRTGDIVAAGELGLKMNELYPARYAKARSLYATQARSPATAASAVMR